MKHLTKEDLLVPCIDCGKIPEIEVDSCIDDVKISCKLCQLSVYAHFLGLDEKNMFDCIIQQINMWNRANMRILAI